MQSSRHAEYYEAESFWDGQALRDPGNISRIEHTIDMVPADARLLLDVGCGNGMFGYALMRRRPDMTVIGVDRSKAALKHAKFAIQQASIDSLPFGDRSFEVVSCLQVIEHLPNEIYIRALAQIARVSQKYILIGVPFNEDLEAEITQCPQCRTVFNVNLHLRKYELSDLYSLFTEFGFEMVRHDFPAAKTRVKYLNEISAFLKGGKRNRGFISPLCPVCSYTEGDKTPLNQTLESARVQNRTGVSLAQRIKQRTVLALEAVLPAENVHGYWVIALYSKARRDNL